MPLDGAREQGGFLDEFLGVVFAKVRVGEGWLVEGEDVIGRFEFGHCDKTNLKRPQKVGGVSVGGQGGEVCQDEIEIEIYSPVDLLLRP